MSITTIKLEKFADYSAIFAIGMLLAGIVTLLFFIIPQDISHLHSLAG